MSRQVLIFFKKYMNHEWNSLSFFLHDDGDNSLWPAYRNQFVFYANQAHFSLIHSNTHWCLKSLRRWSIEEEVEVKHVFWWQKAVYNHIEKRMLIWKVKWAKINPSLSFSLPLTLIIKISTPLPCSSSYKIVKSHFLFIYTYSSSSLTY